MFLIGQALMGMVYSTHFICSNNETLSSPYGYGLFWKRVSEKSVCSSQAFMGMAYYGSVSMFNFIDIIYFSYRMEYNK